MLFVSPRSHYIYMVCCLSTALGFSTSENIGYTLQARQGTGVVQGLSDRAFTAYSRAVVAIAAHGLCGGLVGAGLTDKHVLGELGCTFIRWLHPTILKRSFGGRDGLFGQKAFNLA
jgi:RsiW-degrading membrane proteinase PrsW (M82 family)